MKFVCPLLAEARVSPVDSQGWTEAPHDGDSGVSDRELSQCARRSFSSVISGGQLNRIGSFTVPIPRLV